jgi:phage FluMu gp28-like protein
VQPNLVLRLCPFLRKEAAEKEAAEKETVEKEAAEKETAEKEAAKNPMARVIFTMSYFYFYSSPF